MWNHCPWLLWIWNLDGSHRLAFGTLREVALAVKACLADGPGRTALVFDDQAGSIIDRDALKAKKAKWASLLAASDGGLAGRS